MVEACLEATGKFHVTKAARELVWQDWDDVYIIFQTSSTETHVFNETTATVLGLLQANPTNLDELRVHTAEFLGVAINELVQDDLMFVTRRLEELGLVEWLK
ncbi:MAG: HPr-rel-A system PqqD family peptide chaperone [Candidatus Methylumidiphilus sp.]